MKKLFYILSVNLIFITIFSCDKEDVNNNEETIIQKDSLIIWQYPLTEDTSYSFNFHPKLVDNKLIINAEPFNEEEKNSTVRAIDIHSKEIIWEWDSYFFSQYQSIQYCDGVYAYEDRVALNSGRDSYCVDLETGETIWKIIIPDGDAEISGYGSNVYQTVAYGPNPFADSSSICQIDIFSGEIRKLFTVYKDSSNYEVNLCRPLVYRQDGDTILVFSNSMYIMPPNYKPKVDLYSYNLSKDSILWHIEAIDPTGQLNVRPPLIKNNLIYFGGMSKMFCIEAETGKIKWQKRYPRNSINQGSNYLIYYDKIIIKLDNGDLIAFNKNNGELMWRNSHVGACCVELRLYEDRLYFSSGYIFIVDANTGKTLYKIGKPNNKLPHDMYLHAISVDLENKRMYTTNGYFLNCFKLPK